MGKLSDGPARLYREWPNSNEKNNERATGIEPAFRSRPLAGSLGRLNIDVDKPAWTSLNVMTKFMTKKAWQAFTKTLAENLLSGIALTGCQTGNERSDQLS